MKEAFKYVFIGGASLLLMFLTFCSMIDRADVLDFIAFGCSVFITYNIFNKREVV